ncbi:MAG TPA: SOS response-associated peptidase [Thermoanaerobaculia bacterium]|jgi:putative SOS response-associated peptidase YedK|nr:SOS response-associated peptidase [Thermoanaerobaculia bacterium]
MCGRYTLTTPPELIADLFEVDGVPMLPPRWNVAPTQEAAVVRVPKPGEKRRLDLLRWGLVPGWADDPSIGNRLINARAETVAEKPSFKRSLQKQRCLVLADGFYEWRKEGKLKQPIWIHRTDGRPFAFAGLWASWRPKGAPREVPPLETFTILTTTPNELMKPIHDRMPVIVAPEDYGLWLDPAVVEPERVAPLLRPAPESGFETREVSRGVNSPAHDAPDCIAPISDPA